MRTIELHLDSDDIEQLVKDTAPGAFDRAITRLSTWGLGGYDSVMIFRDGKDSDLIAVYTGSGGTYRFVLGAVYDAKAGTYSFHS
jgi:hypothetical protein